MKIDGKLLASLLLTTLSEQVPKLNAKKNTPHLVVILVGNDQASHAYVNQKKKKGEEIGMHVTVKQYEETVTTEELLKTLQSLNKDKTVHGIIIQQPLPGNIDVALLLNATNPQKDVDGFHKQSAFTPPIAEAAEEILKDVFYEIATSTSSPRNDNDFIDWLRQENIVVIGKGETGGAPIIEKMKKLGVKPHVIDSKTDHPEKIKREADIIISCVGRSRIVKAEDIKKGVILISIGMFRGEDGKLHGDYEEEEIKNVASFYTPVPGGVGPVNVAMLLKNVVQAAKTPYESH